MIFLFLIINIFKIKLIIMENGNGHRRMNFYHKKSSRVGRSSSMERPGKFTSSLASAEFIEGDYKLTDDVLYENKMKNKFEDDSHDTILLNKYSTNNNNENYFFHSHNFLEALEKSKNYFSQRNDLDNQVINNKKYVYENQKKLLNEIQYLNEEYKKEKIKYKDLVDKINQKKFRENMFPNFTNNSDISPEELKKNKEYISYLENSIGKLEKENNELIIMLNSRKQETENHNNNNYSYEEEQYYKLFIKKEINRLKELLVSFNNQTHNQYYFNNDFENNFTKESNQNNEKSEKNLSFNEDNDLTITGEEYRVPEKIGNNTNNNNSNNKYMNPKNNLSKKKEFCIPNNNINNNNNKNGNKIGNNERNSNLTPNEFIINSTSHSGMNNNQKTKSKIIYGNINNHKNQNNNFKSQRTGSKKKK